MLSSCKSTLCVCVWIFHTVQTKQTWILSYLKFFFCDISCLEISWEARCVKAKGKWRDLLRYKDSWYVLPGKWQKLSLQSSLFTSSGPHLFIHSLLPLFLVVLVPFSPPSRSLFLAFSYTPAPALPPFFSCYFFFAIFHFPPLALISAALVICVPFLPPSSPLILRLPSPHSSSSYRHALCLLIPYSHHHHHHLPHYVHTIYLSVTQCFWFPLLFLLSLCLFFHFFSPVCCDGSQAGDSCNSRQSGSGHRQREGGRERGDDDEGEKGGCEDEETVVRVGGGGNFFLLARFWSLPKQKQRRRACGAGGRGGWLLSIPRARISSVLMHRRLAATSVKLLYSSPWQTDGTSTEVVVLCLNKQQLWACRDGMKSCEGVVSRGELEGGVRDSFGTWFADSAPRQQLSHPAGYTCFCTRKGGEGKGRRMG